MKNYLTKNLIVLTVRNNRVVYSESVWDYLKGWFHKGLLINFTDSSKYRNVKPSGLPIPIKKEIYA